MRYEPPRPPARLASARAFNNVSLYELNGRIGEGGYGTNHVTITALIVPDRRCDRDRALSTPDIPRQSSHSLRVTRPAVENLVIFYLRGAWDPPTSLTYRSTSGLVLWSQSRP